MKCWFADWLVLIKEPLVENINFTFYVNRLIIVVMMMFFELFYSEKFLSSQAGLEPTRLIIKKVLKKK